MLDLLPAEMIFCIADCCSTKDYLSLRLTCRNINAVLQTKGFHELVDKSLAREERRRIFIDHHRDIEIGLMGARSETPASLLCTECGRLRAVRRFIDAEHTSLSETQRERTCLECGITDKIVRSNDRCHAHRRLLCQQCYPHGHVGRLCKGIYCTEPAITLNGTDMFACLICWKLQVTSEQSSVETLERHCKLDTDHHEEMRQAFLKTPTPNVCKTCVNKAAFSKRPYELDADLLQRVRRQAQQTFAAWTQADIDQAGKGGAASATTAVEITP